MKKCMDRAECFNWLSVLYLIILSKYISNSYIDILWIWITIILVAGNAKRVYIMKYEYILCYIRRLIYVVPFFCVLVNIRDTVFHLERFYWLIIGSLIGISFQIPKLKDWIIIWDYEILELNRKPSYHYLSSVILLIWVPIGEELFYRAYILEQANSILWGILTSSLLFILNHFGTKWHSKFSMYDLIVQIMFSVISCYLCMASKSVLPSIFAHSFYNLPLMIYNIRGYILCKRKT